MNEEEKKQLSQESFDILQQTCEYYGHDYSSLPADMASMLLMAFQRGGKFYRDKLIEQVPNEDIPF